MNRDRDRFEVNEDAERERKKIQKFQEQQFKDDFVKLMSTPGNRRVVFDFINLMQIDGSPFNTNSMAQSHGIGMQDAARWWLKAIRDCCPEREAQMRAEANTAARLPPEDEDDPQ